MTAMLRTITDPNEADAARNEARDEFLEELEKHDRAHLVTENAMQRWFSPRPRIARATAIREQYGPPESIWLERRTIPTPAKEAHDGN